MGAGTFRPVLNTLPHLLWRQTSEGSAASETAALMIYVALVFSSVRDEEIGLMQVARSTYDELQEATGLSRKLLSSGIARLQEVNLVFLNGSNQKRTYSLIGSTADKTWFKLPCRAIVRSQQILPFHAFNLRSKHELHALKLYLYLAARRRNELQQSFASYEKIHDGTAIAERDVRKAISVLIGSGLVRNVNRVQDEETKVYGPNLYYFSGCESLSNAS